MECWEPKHIFPTAFTDLLPASLSPAGDMKESGTRSQLTSQRADSHRLPYSRAPKEDSG